MTGGYRSTIHSYVISTDVLRGGPRLKAEDDGEKPEDNGKVTEADGERPACKLPGLL
jgi:hypothetical protein